MPKQIGWVDVRKEEGFLDLYVPHLKVEYDDPHKWGPQSRNMSEVIEWFEAQVKKRVVAIVASNVCYRIYLEEDVETPISAEV